MSFHDFADIMIFRFRFRCAAYRFSPILVFGLRFLSKMIIFFVFFSCHMQITFFSGFAKAKLHPTFALRPSSDLVLLLCRTTRLWHGSDSNVVLLSGKFINCINVFWWDCVSTESLEENCYEALVNP